MATTIDQARFAKDKVKRILARHSELQQALSGLGIGSADGGYFVKVNLASVVPDQSALPDFLDGVPVKVEVVGKVQAL